MPSFRRSNGGGGGGDMSEMSAKRRRVLMCRGVAAKISSRSLKIHFTEIINNDNIHSTLDRFDLITLNNIWTIPFHSFRTSSSTISIKVLPLSKERSPRFF